MMAGQPKVELMNSGAYWLTKNSSSAAIWPSAQRHRVVEQRLLQP